MSVVEVVLSRLFQFTLYDKLSPVTSVVDEAE